MTTMMRGLALSLMIAVAAAISSGVDSASAQEKKAPAKAKAKAKAAKAADGAPYFEIYKDAAGKFRFRLKDGDGSSLASSGKGYETKLDVQKAIDTIKAGAAKAKVDDQAK